MSDQAISGALIADGAMDEYGREAYLASLEAPVRIVLPPLRPAEASYAYLEVEDV